MKGATTTPRRCAQQPFSSCRFASPLSHPPPPPPPHITEVCYTHVCTTQTAQMRKYLLSRPTARCVWSARGAHAIGRLASGHDKRARETSVFRGVCMYRYLYVYMRNATRRRWVRERREISGAMSMNYGRMLWEVRLYEIFVIKTE